MNELEDLDSFESADDLDAKIKELQAAKVRARTGKKSKEELSKNYKAFTNAKKIYDSIGLSMHRSSQPRYFHILHTTKTDKAGNILRVQDINYFTHGSLYPNFTELESELSRKYLRRMIDGGTISIQNPNGSIEQHSFDKRVYDKLTNTGHKVDDVTFNLVNLDNRVIPEDVEDAECPTILKALLYSITGNVITYNEEKKEWECDKPDTLEWFEKWIYGTVYANIGDNSMSMPVIFGTGKVGKNALFDIVFRQLLGTHCCFSGTWDIIDSNFNSFKLGKVFMFTDEIPALSEWNKIKNMTGSPVSYVKEKYGPEFEVDNCIVNAFGSNQTTYPLPWEDGEQMMRVSPIKTNPKSTFAENTVKLLNKEFEGQFGEDAVDALIRATGNNPDEMTVFKKGDFILRNIMANDWQSREGAQKLLNYLHKKFKGNTFQLSPLRSTDWYDIKTSKVNGYEVTIDYIRAVNPVILTTSEAYEIYTTIMADTTKAKQKSNFKADIKDAIVALGYEFKHSATLKNGIREDIFIKPDAPRRTASSYESNYDKYIKTDIVTGKQVRHLIWPDDADDGEDGIVEKEDYSFITKYEHLRKVQK